jgi:hypothetical protein
MGRTGRSVLRVYVRGSCLSSPSCPSRQNPAQLLFAHPVFRDLFFPDEQHRNLEAVESVELGIPRNIDLVQCKRDGGGDLLDDGFHLVAEMTARSRVERKGDHFVTARHSEAMASAACRGSAAAMIGRPTTR